MKTYSNQGSRNLSGKQQVYNTLKQQLQAQNQSLMRERSKIEWQKNPQKQFGKKYHNMVSDQSAYFEEEDNTLSGISPVKNQEISHHTAAIKNKIKQIIQICNAESNNSYGTDYKEIVEAQEQILTYLDKINYQNQSYVQNGENPEQNQSQIKRKQDLKIRKELNSKGMRDSIGDDAMEMIEEIQRKALVQIESLRNDKINLMKKINEEVRAHNQEKRNRILLQSHVVYLTQQLARFGVQAANPMKFDTLSNNGGFGLTQQNFPAFSQRNPVEQVASQQNISQNTGQFSHHQQTQQPQQYHQANIRSPKNSPLLHKNNSSQQLHSQQINRPQSSILHQGQVQSQIKNLQQENRKMKRVLSQASNPHSIDNLKNQLRAQLMELNKKVRYYQEILNNRNMQGGTNPSDIQNLLEQGSNLTANGQRLMRIKSKPEFGGSNQGSNLDRGQIVRQINFLKQKIQELETQNLSLSKNNNERFTFVPSAPKITQVYTPKASSRKQKFNRFSPSKYEGLINEMKYATKM